MSIYRSIRKLPRRTTPELSLELGQTTQTGMDSWDIFDRMSRGQLLVIDLVPGMSRYPCLILVKRTNLENVYIWHIFLLFYVKILLVHASLYASLQLPLASCSSVPYIDYAMMFNVSLGESLCAGVESTTTDIYPILYHLKLDSQGISALLLHWIDRRKRFSRNL